MKRVIDALSVALGEGEFEPDPGGTRGVVITAHSEHLFLANGGNDEREFDLTEFVWLRDLTAIFQSHP